MNTSKFLLTLATIALATACSNDNEAPKTFVGDSDVEIKLSIDSETGTRASIESDGQGLFEADSMGIFMLATVDTDVNPNGQEIDWANNVHALRLKNVAANARINPKRTATDIVWADGQARRYPMDNCYSYRFYGYYPRVENGSVLVQDNNRIYVSFYGLDGTQDIIWGRSEGANPEDEHEKYRYSARYFCQEDYDSKVPSLTFEHKMLRMQFYIQGVEDENAEESNKYVSANIVSIDTIMIAEMPTRANLVIANLGNDEEDGTLYPEWRHGLADIGVRGENDGPFEKTQVNNDDLIKVGQPILLPVLDEDAESAGITKYRIKIRLRNEVGDVFDDEKPIELKVTSNSKFEAGKTYKVVLKIAGLKQVFIFEEAETNEDFKTVEDSVDPGQSLVRKKR